LADFFWFLRAKKAKISVGEIVPIKSVDYFEEFPTKKSLSIVKKLPSGTRVYWAFHNLKEFLAWKKVVTKTNPLVESAYWPILKKDEGYWFSALTPASAIRRVTDEILVYCQDKRNALIVLWDAELPTLKKKLYVTQGPFMLRNRSMIRRFFKKKRTLKNLTLVTAEYPHANSSRFLTLFCLSFDPKRYQTEKIVMIYSSMLQNVLEGKSGSFLEKVSISWHMQHDQHRIMHAKSKNNVQKNNVQKELRDYITYIVKRNIELYSSDVSFAIGPTAVGILGNEPLLSEREFVRDCNLLHNLGVSKVTLFRLDGMERYHIPIKNPKYTF
jgi:hypothetical protein